jgi:predicted transcriptional regulator
MRTLVDIEDGDVKSLDEIAKEAGQSRAALIRQAITDYLARRHRKASADAFGLWGKRQVDGLDYQRGIRREW